MKRKKASRKTRKTPAAVAVKPLRDLGGEVLKQVPASARDEINGIPLPPDLEQAVRYYARVELRTLVDHLAHGACCGTENDFEVIFEPLEMEDEHVAEIHESMVRVMRQGFYLALLRYADDLKRSAEAAPLLEGLREAASKGAAVRRKQAEPNRKAVCKRFRELRKTIPKKTVRYLKIAGELGMSERHVQRIVNAADLD